MTEFLLSTPPWLIGIIAGLVAAILGLAVVRLLRLRGAWLRYLPLAFAALGYAAADRFALPALQDTDSAYCLLATNAAADANRRLAGSRPDNVTTFVAAVADCEARTLVSRYTTEAARSDIDPAGLANVEAAFTADTCGDSGFRRLLRNGWSIENEYAFTAGPPLLMQAAC